MKRNTSLPWLAAVALTIAVLTATPAAAGTANEYPEDALKFASVATYRYEGHQPVDLYAEVVDVQGTPIDDATVTVEVNTSRSAQPVTIHLENEGNGIYTACDAAILDSKIDSDIYKFTATKDRMHPAIEKVKSQRGDLCSASEPQIHIASIQAAKLDGEDQPLSVIVELVDDFDNPVEDANVLITVTNLRRQIEMYLPDVGGGSYADCDVALLDTTGAGQIEVTVFASAPGYASATARTENTVGNHCATTAQDQATARRTR